MHALFDLFMRAADIADAEHALIERSIGSAVLDKLRGHGSLPSQIYKAKGGNEPMTRSVFSKIDEIWHDVDVSAAERDIVPSGQPFAEAYHAWDLSGTELALIERTIGRAMLDKMRGRESTLVDVYTDLGGRNPTSHQIFSNLGERWARFNPSQPLEALRH